MYTKIYCMEMESGKCSTLKLPVTLEVLCRLSKKTQALNQSIIRAELLQESDTMT